MLPGLIKSSGAAEGTDIDLLVLIGAIIDCSIGENGARVAGMVRGEVGILEIVGIFVVVEGS